MMGEGLPAIISFNYIINISSLRPLCLFSPTSSPHQSMTANDKCLLETHMTHRVL